jgi:hypothetical protein
MPLDERVVAGKLNVVEGVPASVRDRFQFGIGLGCQPAPGERWHGIAWECSDGKCAPMVTYGAAPGAAAAPPPGDDAFARGCSDGSWGKALLPPAKPPGEAELVRRAREILVGMDAVLGVTCATGGCSDAARAAREEVRELVAAQRWRLTAPPHHPAGFGNVELSFSVDGGDRVRILCDSNRCWAYVLRGETELFNYTACGRARDIYLGPYPHSGTIAYEDDQVSLIGNALAVAP